MFLFKFFFIVLTILLFSCQTNEMVWNGYHIKTDNSVHHDSIKISKSKSLQPDFSIKIIQDNSALKTLVKVIITLPNKSEFTYSLEEKKPYISLMRLYASVNNYNRSILYDYDFDGIWDEEYFYKPYTKLVKKHTLSNNHRSITFYDKEDKIERVENKIFSKKELLLNNDFDYKSKSFLPESIIRIGGYIINYEKVKFEKNLFIQGQCFTFLLSNNSLIIQYKDRSLIVEFFDKSCSLLFSTPLNTLYDNNLDGEWDLIERKNFRTIRLNDGRILDIIMNDYEIITIKEVKYIESK